MRAEPHRRWYTFSKSRRPVVDEVPYITSETRTNGALRQNHRILCPPPEVLSARVFPEGCGGDWTMWRRDPARCRLRTRYPHHWLRSFCRRLLGLDPVPLGGAKSGGVVLGILTALLLSGRGRTCIQKFVGSGNRRKIRIWQPSLVATTLNYCV